LPRTSRRDPAVAEAFRARDRHAAFGTLPAGPSLDAIVERHNSA